MINQKVGSLQNNPMKEQLDLFYNLQSQDQGQMEIEERNVQNKNNYIQNKNDENDKPISYDEIVIKQLKKKNKRKKQSVEYQIMQIEEMYIPRNLTQFQKCYILAGGIALEIENMDNRIDENILDSLKSILNVTKFQNGSIQISVESRNTIKQFDQVISILERTQNNDDYIASQKLKAVKQVISNIHLQIHKIISDSNPDQFLQFMNERKKFLLAKQQQLIFEEIKSEDFTKVACLQINLALETITLSNFHLSQALIALLGSVNEEMIQNIMRKGMFQIFNKYSRKQFLHLQTSYYLENYPTVTIKELPSIEIVTLDNILINCSSQIKIVKIQYPEYLQFQDKSILDINEIECVIFLKFNITQDHLQKVINLRSQFIEQQQTQDNFQSSQDDFNYFILQNFDYYMQSEIFLQSFYQVKYKEKTKIKNNKNTCSFKLIQTFL